MPAKKKAKRKSSKGTQKVIAKTMRRLKKGKLKSGKKGKGGKVTSRKQALAIAFSEARKQGKKVPKKPAKSKKTSKKK